MKCALIVFRKEMKDALRDRRTLLVVLISGVLLGPLVLVLLSNVLAQFEAHRSTREVYAVGMEHAPTLRNYIERQTYAIRPAPANYEESLRNSKFGHPVIRVPEAFEEALAHGEHPTIEVVSDASNKLALTGRGPVVELLQGFAREHATLALALRGVSPEVIDPIGVEELDLASEQTRASEATGMLPFFVIMAVLYGAMSGALDTTAGERERGSLEPLLMNPVEYSWLVLGKWAAVAGVSMLIAVLSCLSFLPAQLFLRSDTLQAIFRYGPHEALLFIVTLLPLAAALSASLMAVAIRCKTVKEAQASVTVVILAVSLLPLVTMLDQTGEAPWHLWVPVLAQHTLMTRVLRGEAFGPLQLAVPLLVCSALTVLGIGFVSRWLRRAAVQ